MKTLGERCVEFAYRYLGMMEQPPGSNTGPFIKQWLLACYRRGDDPSKPIGLTASNWCAAFACAPLDRSKPGCVLRPEEKAPHGVYAGVVEIVADAWETDGDLLIWRPVELVREGKWQPRIGDLAIWDRSKPSDPSTNWWRHVNRVTRYKTNGLFDTIGGNEYDKVSERSQTIHNAKLLGFVQYPEFATEGSKVEGPPPPLFTEREREQILNQVMLTNARILEDSMWHDRPTDFSADAWVEEQKPTAEPAPEELSAVAELFKAAEEDPDGNISVGMDTMDELRVYEAHDLNHGESASSEDDPYLSTENPDVPDEE